MKKNRITNSLNTNIEENLPLVPFSQVELQQFTAEAEDYANLYLMDLPLDSDSSETQDIENANLDPTNSNSQNNSNLNIPENPQQIDKNIISKLVGRCFKKTKESTDDLLYISRLSSIKEHWNDQKLFDAFNEDCETLNDRKEFLNLVRNPDSKMPEYKYASKFILAKVFKHCHTFNYEELEKVHKSFNGIISSVDSSEIDAKRVINFIVYGFVQLEDLTGPTSASSIVSIIERNYKDMIYMNELPQSVSLKLKFYSMVQNAIVSSVNQVLLAVDPTHLITNSVSQCKDLVVSNPKTTLALVSSTGIGVLAASGVLTPSLALKIIYKVALAFLNKNKMIKSPTESISEDRDFWFDER